MPEPQPTELHTLRDFMRYAVSQFNAAQLSFGHGTNNAWDEAAYLLLHTLHLPLEKLDPFLDAQLTHYERENILKVIEKRVQERLPASYITHEAWLSDCRFYVDESVIVPRSFIAELITEQFYPWIPEPEAITHSLDLCTGSGCLAIMLALAFPHTTVDAVDLSLDALKIAQRNVEAYTLTQRIQLIHSNLFNTVEKKCYELIISNPPYVNTEAMQKLPTEYRHEPHIALAGGTDGLNLVRPLIQQAKEYLSPEGLLIVEIGHNKEALETAFPKIPFTWLETTAGNEYVFLLRREDLP